MSSKKKNTLLVLHGALGAASQFQSLKEKLLDHYDVITPDFYGHGASSSTKNFDVSGFKKQLQEFIEAFKLEGIDVFGYSMGGFVALALANEKPALVNRIMCLGTKFHWTPESAAGEIKMLNPEIVAQKVPAFARVLSERHTIDWHDNMLKTAEMMSTLGEKSEDLYRGYDKIPNQIAICRAEEDSMVSEEESIAMANRLPNATFQTIPNSQHPWEKVDKDLMTARIRKFFS